MARELYPTKHSIAAMRDRGITWADVVDVVNNPEVVYGPDARKMANYQKGLLCAVVAGDGRVITVLLRRDKHWTNEEARNR